LGIRGNATAPRDRSKEDLGQGQGAIHSPQDVRLSKGERVNDKKGGTKSEVNKRGEE